MDEKEAQDLYGQFSSLQEQAQTLNSHLEQMQEQLRHIDQTRTVVTDLKALQKPAETWVPIAPGAYIKATTHPLESVLLNIGANVAVEKKPEDVLVTLDEHKKVLEELSDAALKELKEILAQVETIKQKVEAAGPHQDQDTTAHDHADHSHHGHAHTDHRH